MIRLPIDDILPELTHRLSEGRNVVLHAEPGAGKTTRVPLSLLRAPWLGSRKILMLEPRRLAAQSAASYMAAQLKERVGETVGYRIRGESKVGKHTVIEVVTEGILTRYLQADPSLESFGIIIFDEFHERSIHADLGLAFCLESQAVFREELRLLVMSATLEGEAVQSLMTDAHLISSPGRTFPVSTTYLGSRSPWESGVVPAIEAALREESGDLLVFLPGRGEILRCQERLSRAAGRHLVLPLFSDVGAEAQARALAPPPAGTRKVVLATSIAETSITIPGVSAVIDSGLMRIPRYDPRRGMGTLETVRVSIASAEQRRGRAGRTGPGMCYRLWERADEVSFPRFNTPEIVSSDLTSCALELALWGVRDPSDLKLLDPPPQSSLEAARDVLVRLGALDDKGHITPHGKTISNLGIHPRLANMLVRARSLSCGSLGCDLAALLDERDILAEGDVDLASRWYLLDRFCGSGEAPSNLRGALSRIARHASRLRAMIGEHGERTRDDAMLGVLVAYAYPERLAKRRGDSRRRYLTRGGGGAELPDRSLLDREEYLAIADLEARGAHGKIFLAEPVSEAAIREHFGDACATSTVVEWSPSGGVRGWIEERLGALTLNIRSYTPSEDERTRAVAERVLQEGVDGLPWSDETRVFRARVQFLAHYTSDTRWPDLSDEGLRTTLVEWISSALDDDGTLHSPGLLRALRERLTWPQLEELEREAPTHIVLPTGTRAAVNYTDGDAPSISAMLQELFGQRETPRVGHGRVAVTIRLLSPARRPLQITRDLENFWRHTYFEVRKEMRARYPKHHWPEDPLSAAPTRRAKPRV